MFRMCFPWTSLNIPHHHLSIPQMFSSWCLKENLTSHIDSTQRPSSIMQITTDSIFPGSLYIKIFSHILIAIYLGKYRFCTVYIVSTTLSFWPVTLRSYMQYICRWDGSTCWLLWEVNLGVQDQPDCQCEWHWWKAGAKIFGWLCAERCLSTQDYFGF